MNYEIMDQMKEYEPEFDQMLFNFLYQDQLLKVYYDEWKEELYQSLYLLMI